MGKNFDSFYTELISDQRWFELLRHYKDSTIKSACEKVYASLVADGTVEARPMSENRKHVYNILCKNPGDKPKPQPFQVQEAEKKAQEQEKEWQAVTWEERAAYLNKLQEIIKGSTMMSGVPRPSYKEQAEEGLDRPKNMPPYPITSKEEYYVKQRHFEYIKANFEARTGQKLPTWVSEESWNIIYDENHLTDKGL